MNQLYDVFQKKSSILFAKKKLTGTQKSFMLSSYERKNGGESMETFKLTRKQMAELLLSLKDESAKTALEVLQEAWIASRASEVEQGNTLSAFVTTSLPPIYEKLLKSEKKEIGLSINDIVSLGNGIEYSTFSATAVQNWVKRDVKGLIGSPRNGRKYSVEQAAMLFIVEDLKSTLDFGSIRKLLRLVFNNPEDRNDDLIAPVRLYAAYSSVFEDLDRNDDEVLDVDYRVKRGRALQVMVKQRADDYVKKESRLYRDGAEAVSHAIVVATLAVQTSYFQSLARQFLNTAMFIHNLND
jgi:hypothetical protein